MGIICERCGIELGVPPSWGKRFCSKECRLNYKTIVCGCGKPFISWDAKKAPKTCGAIACTKKRSLSQEAKDSISNTLGSSVRVNGIYSKVCKCGREFTTRSNKSKACADCRKKSVPKLTIEQCRRGAYNSITSSQKSNIECTFGELIPLGYDSNNRQLLNGLEIDYLYPNLAVEYHGNWHYSRFHDHYDSVVERDTRKHLMLMERGFTHYIVGWALSSRPLRCFLEQHAFFVSQLFEETSPFKFAYNREVFLEEYELLCKTNGKSGYICNHIINWFHSYRWFQKTKTHGMNSIDYWLTNKDKIIANRIKYSDSSPVNLRRYFLLFDYVPSLFSDITAKNLAKEVIGDKIYDPFAGYGNRMLGVCAAGKNYISMDINHLNVNANRLIIHELGLNAVCNRGDSSASDRVDCDGLITCPPYDDKDDYGEKSDLDYYDMIHETFKRITIRDKGFIIVKPSLVNFDKFIKAVGRVKHMRDINWGGLNRKSIHKILVI